LLSRPAPASFGSSWAHLIFSIASVTAKPSLKSLTYSGVAVLKLSILKTSGGMRACNRSSFSAPLNSSECMIWWIYSAMVIWFNSVGLLVIERHRSGCGNLPKVSRDLSSNLDSLVIALVFFMQNR
jgi:hypothetical protein